jgi:uncharacterized protein with HEPN domain
MRTTREYLEHIVTACNKIALYIEGIDKDAFLTDTKTQDAVIRQVEIIGEAGKNVLDTDSHFSENHEVLAQEFHSARGMRNALAHGYFDVDIEIVWNTATISIPALLLAISTIPESD